MGSQAPNPDPRFKRTPFRTLPESTAGKGEAKSVLALDLHDLSFLFLQGGVNLRDALVGQLLHLSLEPLRLVL